MKELCLHVAFWVRMTFHDSFRTTIKETFDIKTFHDSLLPGEQNQISKPWSVFPPPRSLIFNFSSLLQQEDSQNGLGFTCLLSWWCCFHTFPCTFSHCWHQCFYMHLRHVLALTVNTAPASQFSPIWTVRTHSELWVFLITPQSLLLQSYSCPHTLPKWWSKEFIGKYLFWLRRPVLRWGNFMVGTHLFLLYSPG